MLAASTRLGPYEILAPLGAGGMGEVYRARDTRLGREVAVKVLSEPLANDPNRRARFEREAQVVAALSHPNILAIHDCGTQGGLAYAVTELLVGETLRSRLAQGPLPWRKALEIGAAVAEGLAAAHARGVIHRDLKPENLFLTADGRVKVLDFGLAQVKPAPDSESPTVSYVPVDTEPGVVMGTAGYMAPEQVRGLPADARSDIFALGCVLYEMVTGRRAFARETAAETMTAILHDDPPERADSPRYPPEVERGIRHCLEKKPEERFQSARDLAFALRALLSDSGPAAQPRPPAAGRKPAPRRRRQGIRSVAVLPLANASMDPQAEYLSDGITETMIHTLSRLPRLRVMARSTVFRYKGVSVDPQAVGRELGVEAVVTGRVSSAGDRLTIGVELVDVADGSLLWGEHYKRKLSDILAVEEEISTCIAQNLRLRLSGEDKKPLTRRYTKNAEAYQLYLKGRFYWNRRTEAAFGKSIDYFEQAIRADPDYALAHTGLADSLLLLGSAAFELLPPKETMPRAKRAALRALKIDDSLAEAHTTRAQVARLYEWQWSEAEGGFRRALELDPGYATAHHWYGLHLVNSGRLEEAVAEVRRAQEIDPLSLAIGADVGWCLYFARRYDEAIEEYRKTLEMDPDFSWAQFLLGLAYVQKAHFAEAIELFRSAAKLSGDSTKVLGALGHAYALSGQRAEALQLLGRLQEVSRQKYVSPYAVALVHAGLGEEAEAVEWLEKAYRERAGHLVYLRVDPELDPVRSNQRFGALVRRMKFPG